MGRSNFQFKQFKIEQDRCAMKVTTDACLFGAWTAANDNAADKILDIGAGTGLLSLMMAQVSTATIHAVEIEKECYGQLQENILESPFAEKILALHQDIKTFKTESRFDLIITNPPFHQDQLKSGQANIDLARHDEGLTLAEIFSISSTLISAKGSLFILLPFYRKKDCLTIANELGWEVSRLATVRHSAQHEPFRIMFQFSKIANETYQEEIIIHDADGSYTEIFSNLLRPFYLYL